MRLLLTPFLFAALAVGCQTTDREAPASNIEEAKGPAEPEAGKAEDETPKVGPVGDEDLRRIVYKAMDSRISKKSTLGEDGEQVTEIGDFESFKFTITRLGKGKEDAAGSDVPDNADVDVTGWYKVSVSSKDTPDAAPACTSFDATLTMVSVGGEWQVPEGNEAQITREDGEDCF